MTSNPFISITPEQQVIEAIERFKFDIQYALQVAIKKSNITPRTLSYRMGEHPMYVYDNLLKDDVNPRISDIAKAFAILGTEISFQSEDVPEISKMEKENG